MSNLNRRVSGSLSWEGQDGILPPDPQVVGRTSSRGRRAGDRSDALVSNEQSEERSVGASAILPLSSGNAGIRRKGLRNVALGKKVTEESRAREERRKERQIIKDNLANGTYGPGNNWGISEGSEDDSPDERHWTRDQHMLAGMELAINPSRVFGRNAPSSGYVPSSSVLQLQLPLSQPSVPLVISSPFNNNNNSIPLQSLLQQPLQHRNVERKEREEKQQPLHHEKDNDNNKEDYMNESEQPMSQLEHDSVESDHSSSHRLRKERRKERKERNQKKEKKSSSSKRKIIIKENKKDKKRRKKNPSSSSSSSSSSDNDTESSESDSSSSPLDKSSTDSSSSSSSSSSSPSSSGSSSDSDDERQRRKRLLAEVVPDGNKFSGLDKEKLKVFKFLTYIRSVIHSHYGKLVNKKWRTKNKEEVLSFVQRGLTGIALDWWMSHRNDKKGNLVYIRDKFNSFKRIEKAFTKKFFPKEDRLAAESSFMSMKRHTGETIETYIRNIEDQAGKARITKSSWKAKVFLLGLNSSAQLAINNYLFEHRNGKKAPYIGDLKWSELKRIALRLDNTSTTTTSSSSHFNNISHEISSDREEAIAELNAIYYNSNNNSSNSNSRNKGNQKGSFKGSNSSNYKGTNYNNNSNHSRPAKRTSTSTATTSKSSNHNNEVQIPSESWDLAYRLKGGRNKEALKGLTQAQIARNIINRGCAYCGKKDVHIDKCPLSFFELTPNPKGEAQRNTKQ